MKDAVCKMPPDLAGLQLQKKRSTTLRTECSGVQLSQFNYDLRKQTSQKVPLVEFWERIGSCIHTTEIKFPFSLNFLSFLKVTVVHQLQDRTQITKLETISAFGFKILLTRKVLWHSWRHFLYGWSMVSSIWPCQQPKQFVCGEKKIYMSVKKCRFTIKKLVWCAISRARLIDPIFFTGTIDQKRYRTEILHPFLSRLTQIEIETSWFQQDGTTAHTAH